MAIKDQYLDQTVARDYDRERFSSPVGRTFDRLEKRALRAAMRRARSLSPASAVLDIPCGTGRITELWLQEGSADVVTCIRLMHHLHTDARGRILRELARVSRRFVLINVSWSSPWYRARRRLKRALGQGISTASTSAAELAQELAGAGLRVEARWFVWPLVSEDLVLLLRKGPPAA